MSDAEKLKDEPLVNLKLKVSSVNKILEALYVRQAGEVYFVLREIQDQVQQQTKKE